MSDLVNSWVVLPLANIQKFKRCSIRMGFFLKLGVSTDLCFNFWKTLSVVVIKSAIAFQHMKPNKLNKLSKRSLCSLGKYLFLIFGVGLDLLHG